MSSSTVMVICMATLAIVFFMLTVSTLVYEGLNKNRTLNDSEAKDDWLFKDFHEKVFQLFYKNAKSDKLCGINPKEYEKYCKVLHRKNDFHDAVAKRVEGMAVFIICLCLAWLTSSNLLIAMVFAFIGILAVAVLYMMPFNNLKSKADDRLFRVKDDLPRYLSLLEKAMDMPIDKAMLLTASKFKSPLSEDIVDSINKVSLGAEGWQTTLVDLARTYDIDVFSDLILEIINAYEQGINIRTLITRKSYEVEQERLYAVEAHDAKIKTLIYLPIIGLKILPLMVMICLPMLGDFM